MLHNLSINQQQTLCTGKSKHYKSQSASLSVHSRWHSSLYSQSLIFCLTVYMQSALHAIRYDTIR